MNDTQAAAASAARNGRVSHAGGGMGKRRRSSPPTAVVLLGDALLINIGFFVAWWARYVLEVGREVAADNFLPYSAYFGISLALTACLLVIYRFRGVYDRHRRHTWTDDFGSFVWGTLVGIAVLIVVVFYLRPFSYSRLIFIYAWVSISAILALSRAFEGAVRDYYRRKGIGLTRILVVGAGEIGRAIVQNVVAQPELGYRLVGLADDERTEDFGRFPLLGKTQDVPSIVYRHEIDEVIIALPAGEHRKVAEILHACARSRVSFRIVPDLHQLSLNQLDIVELNGIPLIGLRETPLQGTNLVIKRLLDIVVSATALLLLSPFALLIAIAIKLDCPGPVFVRQVRVGRYGKPFYFYKFRSMIPNADKKLKDIIDQNQNKVIFKMKNDPRITRVGRILRRTSIDESPQIFNILRGDMSLVGPRPPFVWEVEQYEDWYRKRLEVPQGLTGLWQVSGRSDLPFDEMALLDMWYIENWSLSLDLKILLRTVPAVLLGKGAY